MLNCRKNQIEDNAVFRPLTNTSPVSTLNISSVNNALNSSTLLCGFREADGENFYKENTTSNLPTAFNVYNDCTGAFFQCNTMFNGIQGFKMDFLIMSNQGDSLNPNGNKWVNWNSNGNNRIVGDVFFPGADWFYSTFNSDEENPVFNGVLIPQFVSAQPSNIYSCPASEPCQNCITERLANLLSTADTIEYDLELKNALENYVYRNIKDSIQLLYGSTTYAVSLQNFFTIHALSPYGLLENVEELLNNSEYADAYFANAIISTSNLKESNLRYVNELCANENFDNERLDETAITNLLEIAYQYPHLGGDAVYRSRAILGMEVDESQIAFRLKGKDEQIPSKMEFLKVFPNPNDGNFELQLSKKEDSFKEIQIFNQMGVLIKKVICGQETRKITLNLSEINFGIFELKVLTQKGQNLNKKIVIVNE